MNQSDARQDASGVLRAAAVTPQGRERRRDPKPLPARLLRPRDLEAAEEAFFGLRGLAQVEQHGALQPHQFRLAPDLAGSPRLLQALLQCGDAVVEPAALPTGASEHGEGMGEVWAPLDR